MSKKGLITSIKTDGRKLSHSQLEYMRIQSVKQVRLENKSAEDVIKTFGLHRSNIYKWLSKYDKHGFEGLNSSKSSGPKPKLSSKQLAKLSKLLVKNPLQLKFDYALWTIEMIEELIHPKFSITYSNVQIGRLMKRLGLSRQSPLERAIRQDPEKVKNWLAKHYPTIKKEAKNENRKIYFSDEAGFYATAIWFNMGT